MLALMVGVFQFTLGVLRLGLVVNFLSHPVVNGFTNAAAIIIASSQLSKMFGVYVDKAEHHYETIIRVIQAAVHYTHWPTLLMGAFAFAVPTVRIKDIADLQGIRGNQLVGIGLVTGLSGRGDSQNSELLKAAIANLVSNFGFRIDPADVRSRNCAVVTVSCQIPAFVRAGETVDILVSSIGDARTLDGGVDGHVLRHGFHLLVRRVDLIDPAFATQQG